MNDQHTPSPWTVYSDHPSEKNIYYIRVAPARYAYSNEIAVVFGGANPAAGANARLIAAAPDMLEALKAAQKDLETVQREMSGIAPEAVSSALPLIRAAVAKAIGEA